MESGVLLRKQLRCSGIFSCVSIVTDSGLFYGDSVEFLPTSQRWLLQMLPEESRENGLDNVLETV